MFLLLKYLQLLQDIILIIIILSVSTFNDRKCGDVMLCIYSVEIYGLIMETLVHSQFQQDGDRAEVSN